MEFNEILSLIILPILFALVGLAFGSFSNVLIYRFSNHVPLTMTSRSECPKCGHQLAWYDNIPLLSFIFLRGKCRYCKEKISIMYPIIETCGIIIFLGCYYFFNYGLNLGHWGDPITYNFTYKSIIYSFVILDLLVMAMIDHKTMEVPLTLQYILVGLCVATYVTDCILAKNYLIYNLVGLGASLVLLFGVYFAFILIKKQEGLGLADITILCALALALNVFNFVFILLVSSVTCSVIEIIKMAVTKENKPFPFVPYIAFGGVIAIIFGNQMFNALLPGLL